MWDLIFKAAGWLLGLLSGGGKDKTADMARELGLAEQQNATMKQDMATVRAATEAARKAEQEPYDNDPNDRDARR